MNPAQRSIFFARLAAADPNPHVELHYKDPFELLVAVVLSAQATDASVNKATKKLFAVANTPDTMLDLGEDGLREYIKAIGLHNTKARNIIALCRMLMEKHDGKLPHQRAALIQLPGVGWKTASVVTNVAFGQPTIAVDTHIYRVSNRTGLAVGKNAETVSRKLERIVPTEYRRNAHLWLIGLGRRRCKARRPECPQCEVNDLCAYYKKTPAKAFGNTVRRTSGPVRVK